MSDPDDVIEGEKSEPTEPTYERKPVTYADILRLNRRTTAANLEHIRAQVLYWEAKLAAIDGGIPFHDAEPVFAAIARMEAVRSHLQSESDTYYWLLREYDAQKRLADRPAGRQDE